MGDPTPWPVVDTEKLIAAFHDGKSCAEISKDIFKRRYSRNAIVGKLDRLGLKRGRAVLHRTYPKTRKGAPRVVSLKPRASRQRRAVIELSVPSLCLPLVQLAMRSCRWTVETRDDEHLMCGLPGYPYCPHHAARAVNSKRTLARVARSPDTLDPR